MSLTACVLCVLHVTRCGLPPERVFVCFVLNPSVLDQHQELWIETCRRSWINTKGLHCKNTKKSLNRSHYSHISTSSRRTHPSGRRKKGNAISMNQAGMKATPVIHEEEEARDGLCRFVCCYQKQLQQVLPVSRSESTWLELCTGFVYQRCTS